LKSIVVKIGINPITKYVSVDEEEDKESILVKIAITIS
jgi:hypothetical protein